MLGLLMLNRLLLKIGKMSETHVQIAEIHSFLLLIELLVTCPFDICTVVINGIVVYSIATMNKHSTKLPTSYQYGSWWCYLAASESESGLREGSGIGVAMWCRPPAGGYLHMKDNETCCKYSNLKFFKDWKIFSISRTWNLNIFQEGVVLRTSLTLCGQGWIHWSRSGRGELCGCVMSIASGMVSCTLPPTIERLYNPIILFTI